MDRRVGGRSLRRETIPRNAQELSGVRRRLQPPASGFSDNQVAAQSRCCMHASRRAAQNRSHGPEKRVGDMRQLAAIY